MKLFINETDYLVRMASFHLWDRDLVMKVPVCKIKMTGIFVFLILQIQNIYFYFQHKILKGLSVIALG